MNFTAILVQMQNFSYWISLLTIRHSVSDSPSVNSSMGSNIRVRQMVEARGKENILGMALPEPTIENHHAKLNAFSETCKYIRDRGSTKSNVKRL